MELTIENVKQAIIEAEQKRAAMMRGATLLEGEIAGLQKVLQHMTFDPQEAKSFESLDEARTMPDGVKVPETHPDRPVDGQGDDAIGGDVANEG